MSRKSSNVCRWGILSTASISRKNWNSIRIAENAIVSAVASRRVEKAQKYIDENQSNWPFAVAPVALGSYEALINSDDVDAVYIPLPTALRKEWVIKAARAGKHVLCEKPCGATVADLHEMIDACAKNNVQFMDGVMFMHSDRLSAMRQRLDDALSIGNIRRITSHFSFHGGDEFAGTNIRADGALEPLGCLGDLGWYNIRFILWTLNWQMPTTVRGQFLSQVQGNPNAPPVPTEFAAELTFDGGVTAGLYCSFVTELQQWCVVSGDKGYLQIDDFVLPFFGSRTRFDIRRANFRMEGCDFHMESRLDSVFCNEYGNADRNSQEVNMVRAFSGNVLSRVVDPHWPDIAMKTQQVCNACLESATTEDVVAFKRTSHNGG
jgi:predicted dehydrogenase